MDDKHIEQMRNKRVLARYTTRVAKEIDSATTDVHVHSEHGIESVRTAEPVRVALSVIGEVP